MSSVEEHRGYPILPHHKLHTARVLFVFTRKRKLLCAGVAPVTAQMFHLISGSDLFSSSRVNKVSGDIHRI